MQLSYAQNLEDYILDIIFAGAASGTYVDVGGGHPVADNVSMYFYLKGWRGLVVEPQEALAAAYRGVRPRDHVVSCLAGRNAGTMDFHVVEGLHGLSSTRVENAGVAQQYGAKTSIVTKAVERLSTLIDNAGLTAIDFLKIDVEGAEPDVLAGLDLARHRPRVMLIEAVNPNNLAADVSAFEPALLAHDYRFAFFDNLNRYYVAAEAAELAQRFPAKPADWGAAAHLWDCGRAGERTDHPDRALAQVLAAGIYAKLPEIVAAHPALLRQVLEAGIAATAAKGSRDAARAAEWVGTCEQPGAVPSRDADLATVIASDAFRGALGRIACMYDGGHLLE